MHELVKRRMAAWEALQEEARAYVRELAAKLEISAAAIAGSVARGDFRAGSDIDVVIVSDALPADPLQRQDLLWSIDISRVEPKGYTRTEFLERLRRGDPLVRESVDAGIILLDPEHFLASLRARSRPETPVHRQGLPERPTT
ncbi:MAG: nucleotidyltransferase domain-containing protein [Firmicutes bacterium]|nr:nucleotidyltransferase domain-containing protein [Bacillota bacterium]